MKPKNMVEQEAIYDLAELLIRYGFKPTEAMRISQDFWKKYRKKLFEVIA